jgi:ribosome-associated translation inhibitor RaiA
VSTIPSGSQDKPHVEINTQECSLAPQEAEKVDEALTPLRRVVDQFPVADLYITMARHPRSQDYHVKTSLLLPGKTLFTGDRAAELLPAYLRCVRKLVRKVESYKAELRDDAETRKQQKGTYQAVIPDQPCDFEEVTRSVAEQDYAAFRRATLMYEDSVRKRAGRWIQRYPEAEARLGTDLTLADVVEEVFLNAFENYEGAPWERPFCDWLEDLIDPSVRALLDHPDRELRGRLVHHLLRPVLACHG